MRRLIAILCCLSLFPFEGIKAAIDAATIYEFRAASGDSENGGGFADLDPGTSVDYSNQAAAQLILLDGATSGTGVTTFTSATGGFTAAMVGNVLQIHAGVKDNPGWYQITGYTDTNTVTLDQAPDNGTGGVSNADFNVGGALDVFTDNFFDNANAPGPYPGNTVYVKNDGTMTISAGSISTGRDGTEIAVIKIEGYNSTRGDNPTGADRPVIALGAFLFDFDNWWRIANIIFTTTATLGPSADNSSRIVNCKSTNSSGSATRQAFNLSVGSVLARCEAISTLGIGFAGSTSAKIISCYFHDSVTGVTLPSSGDTGTIVNTVFDTCTTGIEHSNGSVYGNIFNNTFYNCTTAITAAANANSVCIVNNIFDANTTGVSWGDASETLYLDYNVWDNGTDVVNVSKGASAVTGDPGLTAPASGDFTVGSGSNALDAGLGPENAGVTGAYKWNIGVDQDDNAAGGGGQTSHSYIGQ